MGLVECALHQAGVSYREYLSVRPHIDEHGNFDSRLIAAILGDKKKAAVTDSFDNINRSVEYMKRENIGFITCAEEAFPNILLEIPDPCYLLYYKGNIDLINLFSIGIIGSRKPSAYGSYVANKFSSELAKKGVVIVSGLAMGIDTLAHKAATESKGKTIAVLGTAIDNIYPRSNQSYAKELVETGNLILSEYMPGYETMPYHFVQRNRLISAVSDGLLVVEAGEKSGTLTTVDHALEQGKAVFAVPGNINSLNSVGTNRLIKQGAKAVTELEDIFEELDYFVPTPSEKANADMSREEKEIYDLLAEKGMLTCEEISCFTNHSIKYIIGILSVLEIKELIKELGNNTYTIC